MGFPWQDVSKSKQVKSLFFKSSLHYLHFEFYQRDGLESPQNQGNDYVTEEGVLGKFQWSKGVLGGCECKDWYLEIMSVPKVSKAKVKVSWIMIFWGISWKLWTKGMDVPKNRSRYVLAILPPFPGMFTASGSGICTSCVPWGLNRELVPVLYDASHRAFGPGHTANVLCMPDVAGYEAAVATYFMLIPIFLGDVQWISLEEKWCKHIYMYIDTWRVLQSSNPTFWHSPILLSGNCAREIHSLSLDCRAMTLEFFLAFGREFNSIFLLDFYTFAFIFCCFHY